MSPTDGSAARRKIEGDFEHFHHVHELTTLEIATLVNAHKIDILVDLNGYTKGARTELFALRPAAIQVAAPSLTLPPDCETVGLACMSNHMLLVVSATVAYPP